MEDFYRDRLKDGPVLLSKTHNEPIMELGFSILFKGK